MLSDRVPLIDRPASLAQAVACFEAMLVRAREAKDRDAERRLSAALVKLKGIRRRASR